VIKYFILFILIVLFVVALRPRPIGPGLGYHGDYATFDRDGNFTGIEIR